MNTDPKIFVVGGAGNVGATLAYTVLLRKLVDEIILVDVAEEMLNAQVADMVHASTFQEQVKIKAGDYSQIDNDDIVVITAGANRLGEGFTRLDLLDTNLKIFSKIVASIKQTGKQPFVFVIANPVDVLTYYTQKELGFADGRVFGSGTLLDSSRFKAYLGQHFGVDPSTINGLVMGEHGDSSFPVFSQLNLSDGMILDQEFKQQLPVKIRETAVNIIKGKGVTNYGIAAMTADVIKAILHDEKKTFTLDARLTGQYNLNDICLGVPCVVGAKGIEQIIELDLPADEQQALQASAQIIKSFIDQKVNV